MHEAEENWALVAFTSLAPLSVGGLLALLMTGGARPAAGLDWAAVVLLGVGLLALVGSLLHLGRPFRAFRAIMRFGTSWLSREVILFGLFLLCLAAYAVPPTLVGGSEAGFFVGVVAEIAGLVGLLATGEVYRLRSRPAWNQWTATISFPLGALSSGLLFGIFVERLSSVSASYGSGVGAVSIVAIVALLLAMASSWVRSSRLQRGSEEERAGYRLLFGRYRWVVALRMAGAACALVLAVLGGVALLAAWIPAAVGELADRILFFNTVIPVSLTARSGVRRFGWGSESSATVREP